MNKIPIINATLTKIHARNFPKNLPEIMGNKFVFISIKNNKIINMKIFTLLLLILYMYVRLIQFVIINIIIIKQNK